MLFEAKAAFHFLMFNTLYLASMTQHGTMIFIPWKDDSVCTYRKSAWRAHSTLHAEKDKEKRIL